VPHFIIAYEQMAVKQSRRKFIQLLPDSCIHAVFIIVQPLQEFCLGMLQQYVK
jgi:hypothetical protein